MPDPASATQVEQATQPSVLPTVSPALLKQLEPLRSAARFDADQMLERVLCDPAALLTVYEVARRGDGGVCSPREAVARIGTSGMADVVKRLRTRPTLVARDAEPWLRRGYRHALAVSALARQLAGEVGVEPDIAAAAGLIHDVGRLAMLASPVRSALLETYEFAGRSPLETAQVERSVLGKSHRQIGGDLCVRLPMPPDLFTACRAHDHAEAQLGRLDQRAARLVRLIETCNRFAKAEGFSGCPSEELAGPPAAMEMLIQKHLSAMRQTLQTVDEQVRGWWGETGHASAEQPLAGIRVSLASPRLEAWNPYEGALGRAGALVARLPWSHASLLAGREAQVLVIDVTGVPLAGVLPQVARVLATPRPGPAVLLADRIYEPEDRIRERGVGAMVYPTPIRAENLVRIVQTLAGRHAAAA